MKEINLAVLNPNKPHEPFRVNNNFILNNTKGFVRYTLKLAKKFCTEEQRREFLLALEDNAICRMEVLRACADLEQQRLNLMAEFFDGTELPAHVSDEEIKLQKQRTRLEWCADYIRFQKWKGSK